MSIDHNIEAVNRETGEINWDCPCLKSALEPPCGEFFKLAFSCYVKSIAAPKGSDCHDLFMQMHDCYEKFPDKYRTSISSNDFPEEIDK